MQPNQGELPQVFDSTGRFLRELGHKGAGPGEFQRAAIVFGDPRDSVFILDWETARLTVVDPSLRTVRSTPFPPTTLSGAVLTDGNLVVNAIIHDRPTVGMAFQLFDRRGYRYAARGDPSRPFLPSNQHLFAYHVAAGRNGSFWAFPIFGRYEIEHWTRGDSVHVLLRNPPPWFVAVPTELPRSDTGDRSPPMSSLAGGWEDEAGRLWVIVRVVDTRGPSKQEVRKNREGSYSVPRDFDREYDTMVEILDPRTGTVVAAERFDALFSLVLGNGRVGHVEEHKDGTLELRVLELGLKSGY